MKKKIIITCSIMVTILLVSIGGYIASRLMIKFPSEPSVYSYRCYTDDGLYYFKNNRLRFLDGKNGTDVVVCNKADCKHDSVECYAYFEIGAQVMYYDGWLYVADGKVYFDYYDDRDPVYNAKIRFDAVKSDGSKRYNIYTSDNGSVTTMKVIDGVIYFTTWNIHDFEKGFDVFNPKEDNTLYTYDLRWKKLKKIKTFYAEDSQETSALYIVPGNSKDLYMTYEVINTDNTNTTSILKYEDNKLVEVKKYNNEYYGDYMYEGIGFLIDNDKRLVLHHYRNEDNTSDILSICETDETFSDEKEVLSVENGFKNLLSGYMMIGVSDYNKFYYDYNNNKFYIAKTAFTGEGKYISDTVDIDEKNNRIYIDAYDYTGMEPGTIYYEDKSVMAVVKFDEFLNENYIDKELVSEEDMKKLSWVKFSGE